jgi:hypothetical protein
MKALSPACLLSQLPKRRQAGLGDGAGVDGFAGGVASADALPVTDHEDAVLGVVVVQVVGCVGPLYPGGFGVAEPGDRATVAPLLAG